MHIRKILIATLLLISLPVAAEFRTVKLAYEVPLNEFNVPVTRNGIISFRQCPGCATVEGRLTPDTRFLLNGNAVELKEFRKHVFTVRNRAAETIVVTQHLETETITSISINL